MKLDQAIRHAIDSDDPSLLATCVDVMRYRGWNYEQCCNIAIQSVPGLTAERWEGMMRCIDDGAMSLRNS